MRIRNFFILGFVSTLALGCARELPATQATASPLAESPTTVTRSTPEAHSANQSAKQNKALMGSFVSGEHPTTGTVRVVTKNGKTFVELDQGFKTFDMGPDLVVALHRSNNVIASTKPPAYSLKEGDYVVIAPLQKFNGAQSYEVPETINLVNYKSVVIWCRKFNATFGAASLGKN
ncbi:DM13 domain-containing protein [Leptothermofonsia sichuanensis E412]|uniref:DM13 domain-containing protein n=1 Tax=Leptothermofonsia sichuanensis TaxID=2917832 RepID=UPI001CA73B4A|nr:DM13 domain-containing protein [Leptothermofonsia sichuanensis]QZZ23041.1 DM13 domain-containing protein [Leptothermofonsia sichuanensis E412]